jgi:uncharacterized membrane protein
METNNKKGIFSILMILFSLLYIVFAAAGLIYNVLYYKEFNLDITNYIDLDECLLLFMPKIRGIGLFLSVCLATALIVHYGYVKPVENRVLNFFIIFLSFAGVILILMMILPSDNPVDRYRNNFLYITPGIILLIGIFFAWNQHCQKKFLSGELYVIIYCLIIMMYSVIGLSILNAKSVKFYKKFSSAKFIFENKRDSADLKNIYIGRTKNFLFTYYKDSNIATAISTEGLIRIELKR